MEFFDKSKVIKLLSNHGKYLVASEDGTNVRQSRRGSSENARWLIETVEYNPKVIRIKCVCQRTYLTASNSAFLLGVTGNKVVLTAPDDSRDPAIEWEPIKDGLYLKLKAFGGTYLRGNGGTIPWKNTITHDSPFTESTRGWVLWAVEGADNEVSSSGDLSSSSSFSNYGSEVGSPVSVHSIGNNSPRWSMNKRGMDLFLNAKTVRLRSHHGKYLSAVDDEDSITQSRDGASRNARWTIEFIDGNEDLFRLKSCFGLYLAASDHPFLLGMTGCKVIQTTAKGHRNPVVEWEPIREGNQVKLKTRDGHFLRANGGLPPWRNSVTHDVPQRSATQSWTLWEVHIVEIIVRSNEELQEQQSILRSNSASSQTSSPPVHSHKPTRFAKQESCDSSINSTPPVNSPPRVTDGGRVVYYRIADDVGNVDKGAKELCFSFKGNGISELTRRLIDETGIDDLIVCTRSPYNGKLYPIRLQLPPSNVTMHIIVVDPSSKLASDFEEAGLLQ